MGSIDLLGIYLNDHLGGSIAGVEVAEKLRSRNEGTPFGAALAGLVLEVKEDRATLEHLMDRLGIERNHLDDQLVATDFDGLAERAWRQRETLEPYRLQAAAFAFSSES
jgi:hypothetical protein